MTMTTPRPAPHLAERSVRIYRALLVAYPREFRREYGDDLVQGFGDLLLFSADRRNVWWRTTRDLITSAAKERGSVILPDRRPPTGVIFVALIAVLATVLAGPGLFLPVILIPSVLLVGLPMFGITRLRRAWVVRRTTGGAVAQQIALGVASFVPAAITLAWLGEDAGYFVFVAVALTLIVGSALGIIWAVATLAPSGRDREHRTWKRPLLILVPCLAVLGFIIAASYNSYRQSLGPPGDHSVENASADTRALWEAAHDADVAEVTRLTTDTCADPWVKFPLGNGRHNAKGEAENQELVLPDDREPPFREISDILGDYMDVWHDRCGRATD
jgi:hypothetical protein